MSRRSVAEKIPQLGLFRNGIGLVLVRRIALLHGGDVRVEDRPGGGARFVVTLGPAAQRA